MISAFELVDWLRLVDRPLSYLHVQRLAAVIEHFYKPALRQLCEHMHPNDGVLWQGLQLASRFSEIRNE
jgi:nucleolar pre-ribosomal-associated protein 1